MIPNISTANVLTVPYSELLTAIGELALEKLPEGGLNDPSRLQEIDKLLARFANLHTYLVYLWAHVSNATNSRKVAGDTAGWLDAAKRKETLYEIAASVKLKQEAVSRMLTVQQLIDNPLHEHRTYNKGTPFEVGIREASTPPFKPQPGERKAGGGWASVPK